MSGREWKPGDVARIEVYGGADGGAVGIWTGEFWAWSKGDGPFDGVSHCHRDVKARPLVVIDPEDREQVERVTYALMEHYWSEKHDTHTAAFQAGLRDFLAPEKPAEPTGLGAVVADASGRQYVQTSVVQKRGWTRAGTSNCVEWCEIDDTPVKVLSEGVTS